MAFKFIAKIRSNFGCNTCTITYVNTCKTSKTNTWSFNWWLIGMNTIRDQVLSVETISLFGNLFATALYQRHV